MIYYSENMRIDNRNNNEIRNVSFIPNFIKNSDGSCLVAFGDTKVICNATFQQGYVPSFLRNTGEGWLTAEYAMLPKATMQRSPRESVKGQQTGRSIEIQRLIGRALRKALDLKKLGENSIIIDCDVIQADGGTRTASITGGFLALSICIENAIKNNFILENPIINSIAAVSCGIVNGEVLLDLNYEEDSIAEVDANFVISGDGNIVDISATSEKGNLSTNKFTEMLQLAMQGIQKINIIRDNLKTL